MFNDNRGSLFWHKYCVLDPVFRNILLLEQGVNSLITFKLSNLATCLVCY